MRFPNTNENLEGKICICSNGRIAVVSGQQEFDFGKAWVGIGLDGKGIWASTKPVITAETIEEYRLLLQERYNGRLTYHD